MDASTRDASPTKDEHHRISSSSPHFSSSWTSFQNESSSSSIGTPTTTSFSNNKSAVIDRIGIRGYLYMRSDVPSYHRMKRHYCRMVGVNFFRFHSGNFTDFHDANYEAEVLQLEEWDGKGIFHRYGHAFRLRTSLGTFNIDAESKEDKEKWVDYIIHALKAMNTAIMDLPLKMESYANLMDLTPGGLEIHQLSGSAKHKHPPFKNNPSCMHSTCMISFRSTQKRPHHCRNCGNTICSEHGANFVPLLHLGYSTSVRVCVSCLRVQRFIQLLRIITQMYIVQRRLKSESFDSSSFSHAIFGTSREHHRPSEEGKGSNDAQTDPSKRSQIETEFEQLVKTIEDPDYGISDALQALHLHRRSPDHFYAVIVERLISLTSIQIEDFEFFIPQLFHIWTNMDMTTNMIKCTLMMKVLMVAAKQHIRLAQLIYCCTRAAIDDSRGIGFGQSERSIPLLFYHKFPIFKLLMINLEASIAGTAWTFVPDDDLPATTEQQIMIQSLFNRIVALQDIDALGRQNAEEEEGGDERQSQLSPDSFVRNNKNHFHRTESLGIICSAMIHCGQCANVRNLSKDNAPIDRRTFTGTDSARNGTAYKSRLFDFFQDQIQFLQALTDVAERLREVFPPAERKRHLAKHLEKIKIPSLAFYPLGSCQEKLARVINVPTNEGTVFTTKARAPTLVYFEVQHSVVDLDSALWHRSSMVNSGSPVMSVSSIQNDGNVVNSSNTVKDEQPSSGHRPIYLSKRSNSLPNHDELTIFLQQEMNSDLCAEKDDIDYTWVVEEEEEDGQEEDGQEKHSRTSSVSRGTGSFVSSSKKTGRRKTTQPASSVGKMTVSSSQNDHDHEDPSRLSTLIPNHSASQSEDPQELIARSVMNDNPVVSEEDIHLSSKSLDVIINACEVTKKSPERSAVRNVENFSFEELGRIAKTMSNKLLGQQRKVSDTSRNRSFSGKAAVKWMIANGAAIDAPHAVWIGSEMVLLGVIEESNHAGKTFGNTNHQYQLVSTSNNRQNPSMSSGNHHSPQPQKRWYTRLTSLPPTSMKLPNKLPPTKTTASGRQFTRLVSPHKNGSSHPLSLSEFQAMKPSMKSDDEDSLLSAFGIESHLSLGESLQNPQHCITDQEIPQSIFEQFKPEETLELMRDIELHFAKLLPEETEESQEDYVQAQAKLSHLRAQLEIICEHMIHCRAERQLAFTSAFGERFDLKVARIRQSSPFGRTDGWGCVPLIIKSNDDLRQEVFCLQLLRQFQDIFDHANLALKLVPYKIFSASASTGFIEVLKDATSLDQLKKRPGYTSLKAHFLKTYGGETTPAYRQALLNFIQSLAAYSLASYFLQIKDRHNGNIMIDIHGHLIHIDFGFILGIAPGGRFSLETAPFKLTAEMVDVMDGPDSEYFREYIVLLVQGFIALQQHADTILMMIAIMSQDSMFPCFVNKSPRGVLRRMKSLFKLELEPKHVVKHVLHLVHRSKNAYRTRQYDRFQKLTNDIMP